MFSIFKNDVSKRFPLRRGIRGRMFPSDYGIFFSIFSFFPLPSIHLVIPSESRELGATRDLELQRSLAQYSCSILLLNTAPCNHPNISTNSFCTLWPLSLLYQFCNSIFCFSKSAFSALSCS